MASMTARISALILAPALLLAGCGVSTGAQMAMPGAKGAKGTTAVGAKSVAPDYANVLSGDFRRAMYWADDAQLVMQIHTTGLNTTKVSSSANVFVSPEAYYAGQPCVFVARHYLTASVAQYTTVTDYNKLGYSLAPIATSEQFAAFQAANPQLPNALDAWAKSLVTGKISAEETFNMLRTYQPAVAPAPGAPAALAPAPQPAAIKRNFVGSRSFLVQQGDASVWNFYSGKQKFTVDATSKAAAGPFAQIDPADRLNTGKEVDLQRASILWLPTSPSQSNNHDVPEATN